MVEINNLVTFNHIFRFPIDKRNKFIKSSFVTLFMNSLVEWEVLIQKGAGFRNSTRDNRFKIKLRESGWRDSWPTPSFIEFKLNIYDQKSERPLMSSVVYKINIITRPQQRNLFAGGAFYETDSTSKFCYFLTQILESPEYGGKMIEICSQIDYKKSELLSKNSLNTNEARPVPVELDYTFDSLTNPDRFDIKLTNNNGEFKWANKEMLFMASDYFRDHLTENTNQLSIDTDSLEAIDIVLTYMLTGKYKPPKCLTPQLSIELIKLSHRFRVISIKTLKNSIERHCYDELCLNEENVQFVIDMLLAAHETNMTNLLNSCLACIINNHFYQFINEYLAGNHPLRDILTSRRGLGRASLASMVKKNFLQMSDVRTFVRQIPTEE